MKRRVALLTKRHLEILALVAQGYSDQEIAEELQIATQTVRNHLLACYDRLKLKRRSREQAVVKAMRLGLLPLSEDTTEWDLSILSQMSKDLISTAWQLEIIARKLVRQRLSGQAKEEGIEELNK